MQSEQNENLKLAIGAVIMLAILTGLYFYNKENVADQMSSESEMPIVSEEEMSARRKEAEAMLKAETEAAAQAQNASSTSATSTSTNATSSATSTSVKSSSLYKDGSYSIDIPYTSPGGKDGIKVSVTLTDDTISAVEVVGTASNKESREYQDKFSKSYKTKVVGKSIDTLKLDVTGGASLTTEAFNKAMQAIKTGSKNS